MSTTNLQPVRPHLYNMRHLPRDQPMAFCDRTDTHGKLVSIPLEYAAPVQVIDSSHSTSSSPHAAIGKQRSPKRNVPKLYAALIARARKRAIARAIRKHRSCSLPKVERDLISLSAHRAREGMILSSPRSGSSSSRVQEAFYQTPGQRAKISVVQTDDPAGGISQLLIATSYHGVKARYPQRVRHRLVLPGDAERHGRRLRDVRHLQTLLPIPMNEPQPGAIAYLSCTQMTLLFQTLATREKMPAVHTSRHASCFTRTCGSNADEATDHSARASLGQACEYTTQGKAVGSYPSRFPDLLLQLCFEKNGFAVGHSGYPAHCVEELSNEPVTLTA